MTNDELKDVGLHKMSMSELIDLVKLQEAALRAEHVRYESLAQEMARKIGQLQEVLRATDIEISYRQDGTLDWKRVSPIPAQMGMPGIRQLAAQLDADEKWTVAEQQAFAPFLKQFPNEGSQGIISLGSAWKHGVAYGVSLQPVQQPAIGITDGSIPLVSAAPVAAPLDVPAASVQPEIERKLALNQVQIDGLHHEAERYKKLYQDLKMQPDSGRDAALEEAAKLCDDLHDTWRWDDEPDSDSGPRSCAAAIRALAAHPANVAQLSELASTQRQVIELQAQLNALLLERNASGSVAQVRELSDEQTEQVVRKVMEDWHIEDGTHLHWERSVTDLCQALAAAKKGG